MNDNETPERPPKTESKETTPTDQILEENKRKNTSGLDWDETTPKSGEKFNRVTDMGEAD